MGRNHFYDLYQQAALGDDPEMKAWHFTSYDNPVIPKREIKKAKARLSSYAFRQEYEASFEARGSQLFKDEWIKYGEKPDEGSYFISVDPAGFETLGQKGKKSKLDETAIAIVKVNQKGWFIEDIQRGRWDLNETAIKIFEAVRIYQPVKIGIEKGIAQQAILTPLSDLMRRCGRFFSVELTTHGNNKKVDRVIWALQGKFENGWVTLNKGEWNAQFLDQLFQFPDPLTNDDMIDALSYIDQLADETYLSPEEFEDDDWEVIDMVAGY
jgi:predicted phage terminase large subunit-like protein